MQHLNSQRLLKLLQFLVNLGDQLTGWGQDDADRPFALRYWGLGLGVCEHWEPKSKCLATACLRKTDGIPARQNDGPRHPLDGTGGLVGLSQIFIQLWSKSNLQGCACKSA